MSLDLEKILASKRALRRNLAARSMAEKLRLLDELRGRTLAIHPASKPVPEDARLREEPPPYNPKKKR
jgi:hypothetical protein